MSGVRCSLVVCAIAFVFHGAPVRGEEGPLAQFGLVWATPEGGWTVPARIARKEVERTFETLGIEVCWRESPEGGELANGELAVVLLTNPNLEHGLPSSVMGAAPTHARAPVVVVFSQSLLANLGWEARSVQGLASDEKLLLGRALGHVVSHELIHVLVPDRAHTESGLMQSRLTRSRLLLPHLRLSEEFTRDLMARFRHGSFPLPARESGGCPSEHSVP